MLQTVRDACKFDPKAIDYALSDQVESLEDLIEHEPGAAEAFFRRPTLPAACGPCCGRASSGSPASPARPSSNSSSRWAAARPTPCWRSAISAPIPALTSLIPQEIVEGVQAEKARVVAISGRSISRDKHLWGDIAHSSARPQNSSNSTRAARRRRTRRIGQT